MATKREAARGVRHGNRSTRKGKPVSVLQQPSCHRWWAKGRGLIAATVVGMGLALTPGVVSAQFLGTNFVTGDNDGAVASGFDAHASGTNATASGDFSMAVGSNATAEGSEAAAFGNTASATGDYSTANGNLTSATGSYSTVTGMLAAATADNASAFGASTFAGAMNATAIGYGASAQGVGSSAFGANAVTTHSNATAIGQNAVTTRNDQMMFGTATNTYTAPGITSAASRAAQTGPIEVVTSDASGNLATADPNALVTGSSAFQGLQGQVNQNTEGVAMALAMAGSAMILPDDKTHAVSVNWGNFEGQNAMAMTGVTRLYENWYLNGGVGVGNNQGTVGGRAGVSFAW